MLFIVAPDSPVFDELSTVDKAEYEVVDSRQDGLAKVDFAKVLMYIGKSVSVSTLQQSVTANPTVKRAIFGQDEWTAATRVDMSGE